MAAHKASPIQLSAEHERDLTALVRAHSTPQKLAERARIILFAATCQGSGGSAAGYLAQDSRSLAPPLAGRGNPV